MSILDNSSRRRLLLTLERFGQRRSVQAIVSFSAGLPGGLLLLGAALVALMYGFSISVE